ncbi:MAG TPA: NADP-dependent oxidoreductase, partial [Janthinobacterium sp.]|nr:NADP-dependent oxidoreductase [Janthinobacterium sp.]
RYHLGVAAMGAWLREGKMQSKVDIVEGIENFPAALSMLFEGKNFGKLVLQVASE